MSIQLNIRLCNQFRGIFNRGFSHAFSLVFCLTLGLGGCTGFDIPPIATATPTLKPTATPLLPTATLHPAALSGRVTSAIDERPVAEAIVEARDVSQRWLSIAQAETNAQGEYRFEGLPPGDYILMASAVGFAREFHPQGNALQDAQVVTYQGTPIENLDFILSQGGSISGQVTKSDGVTPIARVRVQAVPARYAWVDYVAQEATTDAQGNYRLTNLALGEYMVFVEEQGWANEFYPSGNYVVDFEAVLVQPPDEVSGIDLNLDPEGLLSGVVIDELSGQPIPNVTIHMAPPEGQEYRTWGLIGKSNARGEFSVGMLPSNEFLLSARAEGYADEIYNHRPGWSQADRISIQAGQHVRGITIQMRPFGLIQGRLVDESGNPLEGFLIQVNLPDGDHASALPLHTQADGSFDARMPAGVYVVFAEFTPGYVSEYFDDIYTLDTATRISLEVGSQTPELLIQLQLAGRICGVVYASDGVTGVAEAQIYAFPLGGSLASGQRFGVQAVSNANGSYCLEGLPSGTYLVQVSAPGLPVVYYPGTPDQAQAKLVEVTAPNTREGIVIVMP